MLWMLVKLTHQVAVSLPAETTHWPPFLLRSDICPSTALLASLVLSFCLKGLCWYAGLFRATLTVIKKIFYVRLFKWQKSTDGRELSFIIQTISFIYVFCLFLFFFYLRHLVVRLLILCKLVSVIARFEWQIDNLC